MRDFVQDLAEWFEIIEKNKSSGIGFPPSAAGFGDAGGGGKRTDRTPTAVMPDKLWAIDLTMMQMDVKYRQVLEIKHFSRGSNEEKAKVLGVALPTFYKLSGEATEFVRGAYVMAFSDMCKGKKDKGV